MAKIPFAIHRPTGRMVEVSSVPPGRACECVCPSCRQSVQARQGGVYEWHFSHDSSPGNTPGVECDISFHVCCRQFIIESALAGKLPSLMTPGLSISHELSDGVTRAQRVARPLLHEALIWGKGISNFDLAVNVNGYGLHVYFSYPGRESPAIPEGERKAGFLKIKITPIKKAIERDKRYGKNILEQADILFKGEGFKQWLLHPRVKTQAFKEEKAKLVAEWKRENEELRIQGERNIKAREKRGRNLVFQRKNDALSGHHSLLYAHKEISPPARLIAKHDVLSSDERLVARFYSTVYKLYLDAGRSQREAVQLLLKHESNSRKVERLAWIKRQRR